MSLPEPVQVRQWWGADLVHSWALGQDHRRSCLSGHEPWPGSPRAKHLLLLGKHRQLPLCLMPAQCPCCNVGAATYTPRDQRVQGVLQKPGASSSGAPAALKIPEHQASDTSSSRALPSQTHPACQQRKPGLTNLPFCPAPAHWLGDPSQEQQTWDKLPIHFPVSVAKPWLPAADCLCVASLWVNHWVWQCVCTFCVI